MNTSSYSREPPSPKRATPQNASVGEKVSLPSGNPQLARKELYKLPGPTVDELLQRLNGNAPPTKMIGRKAPGTNGFFRACDAVPWKSSAQKEAERLEIMQQQAKEEKGKRNSSQLPPSFATSLHDVDKENAEGRRDVRDGKKCENVPKNALGAPLKTRVNEADDVWKNDDDDDDEDFVRASLTPPKGGEKNENDDDKFSGKRCIEDRVVSAALSARDGKKARVEVDIVEKKDDDEKATATLRCCFDAFTAHLDRIEKANARTGSLILDAIEALGERVDENYNKIENLDRKVFVILEKQHDREEREKAQREELEKTAREDTASVNAKEAPDQGDVKDESKEKIANGINPEVYLGKTFRNCETLSQFVHGFERREHVPAPLRPLLSASSLSSCSSYVHHYQKIVKHIRSVIREFHSEFLEKPDGYDDFLSAAHVSIEDVLARYAKERYAKERATKKRVTWHAAVKIYLTARDEDERDVIEFEWNLSGAVRKAYETMQQL
ncbi:unnamed protein product [Bathycoccus prasinos]